MDEWKIAPLESPMMTLLFGLVPQGYRKQQLALWGLLSAVGIIVLCIFKLNQPINMFELAILAAAPSGVIQAIHATGNVLVHRARGGEPEITRGTKDKEAAPAPDA